MRKWTAREFFQSGRAYAHGLLRVFPEKLCSRFMSQRLLAVGKSKPVPYLSDGFRSLDLKPVSHLHPLRCQRLAFTDSLQCFRHVAYSAHMAVYQFFSILSVKHISFHCSLRENLLELVEYRRRLYLSSLSVSQCTADVKHIIRFAEISVYADSLFHVPYCIHLAESDATFFKEFLFFTSEQSRLGLFLRHYALVGTYHCHSPDSSCSAPLHGSHHQSIFTRRQHAYINL